MKKLTLSLGLTGGFDVDIIGITLNIGDGQYDLNWQEMTKEEEVPDQDPVVASVDFSLKGLSVSGVKEGTDIRYLLSVADEVVVGLSSDLLHIAGHTLVCRDDDGSIFYPEAPVILEKAEYILETNNISSVKGNKSTKAFELMISYHGDQWIYYETSCDSPEEAYKEYMATLEATGINTDNMLITGYKLRRKGESK